ncbi:DUF488 family protein [Facklamia sp. 7083-14-GEN3]|nr:DUF488 family protein [Facklamia sp. 7083-14-GEN3]MCR8969056.1 DUF488 family protein [Facklamia sp. 7083-14-GEN3]
MRKDLNHEAEKFPEFKNAYLEELDHYPMKVELIEKFAKQLKKHNVMLVYGSKNEKHNHALVLKEWLEKNL